MFGPKTPMPKMGALPQPKPALGMPGLRAGSLPGMQRRATMPRLTADAHSTGGGGYDDQLRQNILTGLKSR